MELRTCHKYINLTQKDYTMTFKIHIVSEIEQDILTKMKQKWDMVLKEVGQSVNG